MPQPSLFGYDHCQERTSNINNQNSRVSGHRWIAKSALQIGLHPRPFDELHAERMYLLYKLQKHDEHATQLFARADWTQEQLSRGAPMDERKKLLKNRDWLNRRIRETVLDEKSLLRCLGELHVEIQCQERWLRVAQERESTILSESPWEAGFSNFPLHSSQKYDWHQHSNHTATPDLGVQSSQRVWYDPNSMHPAEFQGFDGSSKDVNRLDSNQSVRVVHSETGRTTTQDHEFNRFYQAATTTPCRGLCSDSSPSLVGRRWSMPVVQHTA